MSTRSFIVDKVNSKVIYCNWDGYPSHNGIILKDNYTNQKQVDKLIGLGDISCLGMILESAEKRKEDQKDQKAIVGLTLHTKAYHRDFGEPWDEVKPKDFDVSLLRELKVDVDYIYQWNGEYWTVLDCSSYANNKSEGVRL